MTWNDLAEEIHLLTPEQKETDVTVHLRGPDEYYKVDDGMQQADPVAPPDVLDPNHPYLEVSV